MNKVGVGIITCDRVKMFDVCFESISDEWYDELVVVDDGKEQGPFKRRGAEFIRTQGGEGVGKAKNRALKHLLDKGCDYIILVEDDMKFKGNLFAEYIKAYKETGIHHFMFGYHGPANKAGISGGKPVPRKIINYKDINIALNRDCVGAVTFFTRESLDKVGLYDESYTNAFEHVDHSYMLAEQGFSTPYWWWSDIANSLDFVEEQKCSEESSTIRPRSDWQLNIQKASQHFIKKHGISPVLVPDTSVNDVIKFIKQTLNKQSQQQKYDLKDKLTFIIPAQVDHKDRIRNIRTTLGYLNHYFNADIIISEQDTSSKLHNICKEFKCKHIFTKTDDFFNKLKLINIAVRETTTPIISIYDADALLRPKQITAAVDLILNEKAQLVYPYDGNFYDVPEKYFDIINETKNLTNVDLSECKLFNSNSVGGVVMIDKKHFWKCGGGNENFKSVGYDDNEIEIRFKKLGTKVFRTKWPLWHLTHTRVETSYDHNPHIIFNRDYCQKISQMSKDELQSHIDKWDWHKDNI